MAWDQDGRIFIARGDGVQVIGGQGFGWVILRKSVLDQHVIHHRGRGDYDPTFYAELRGTCWRTKVDWGCEVRVWTIPGRCGMTSRITETLRHDAATS